MSSVLERHFKYWRDAAVNQAAAARCLLTAAYIKE
jgi:hypothetical protein